MPATNWRIYCESPEGSIKRAYNANYCVVGCRVLCPKVVGATSSGGFLVLWQSDGLLANTSAQVGTSSYCASGQHEHAMLLSNVICRKETHTEFNVN